METTSRRKNKRIAAAEKIILCAVACAAGACGNAASYDYESPPQAPVEQTGSVTVVNAHVVGMGNFNSELTKVALVWLPIAPGNGKSQAVQNVTYHSAAGPDPIDWRIEISSQPPANVIDGMAASGMRYGQAELVVYEDRDRNGELTLHAFGDEPIDVVIGRAPAIRVWWATGAPAEATEVGNAPTARGFSVTYGPTSVDPEPKDCQHDPDNPTVHIPCPPVLLEKAAPITPQERVKIELSNEAVLASYACRGFWGTTADHSDQWPDDTPGWSNQATLGKSICNGPGCHCKGLGCDLDLPVEGRENLIHCTKAETQYVWKDCIPDPDACGTTFCHYGYGERAAGVNPANWPACAFHDVE